MRLGVMMCFGLLINPGFAIATLPPQMPAFVRTQYARYLAEFQAQCPPPNTLEVRTVKQEQPPLQLASFACWSPRDARGDRTGAWLGRLPHPQSAANFVQPMTCNSGDRPCTRTLAQVKAQFPRQLQQAEFQCATKNGTLFFADQDAAFPGRIELRCGFFETRLFAAAGERTQNALESFTGVDIPVARLQLELAQP